MKFLQEIYKTKNNFEYKIYCFGNTVPDEPKSFVAVTMDESMGRANSPHLNQLKEWLDWRIFE